MAEALIYIRASAISPEGQSRGSVWVANYEIYVPRLRGTAWIG
jgi:hypothetical protein